MCNRDFREARAIEFLEVFHGCLRAEQGSTLDRESHELAQKSEAVRADNELAALLYLRLLGRTCVRVRAGRAGNGVGVNLFHGTRLAQMLRSLLAACPNIRNPPTRAGVVAVLAEFESEFLPHEHDPESARELEVLLQEQAEKAQERAGGALESLLESRLRDAVWRVWGDRDEVGWEGGHRLSLGFGWGLEGRETQGGSVDSAELEVADDGPVWDGRRVVPTSTGMLELQSLVSGLPSPSLSSWKGGFGDAGDAAGWVGGSEGRVVSGTSDPLHIEVCHVTDASHRQVQMVVAATNKTSFAILGVAVSAAVGAGLQVPHAVSSRERGILGERRRQGGL